MRLEQRDDPACRRQGSIQGGDRRGLARFCAVTDVEAAGLIGGAVARTGELAVGVLRRHPRFNVELASRAGSEIPGRDVDNAIAEAEGLEHALLHRNQAIVLCFGVLGEHVGEHFQFVELVHTDDPPGVFAARPGLAAVAGRPAGVAERTIGQIEDLVFVVAGERNLARAGEVKLVGWQVVDLVGVLAEKPGAVHDLRPHQRRRDERRESGRERTVERQVHQRDLEAGADAAQKVEPGSGDLGAASHVNGAEQFAELKMVARLEIEGGDVAVRTEGREVLFGARRNAVDHWIGYRAHDGGETFLGIVRGRTRRLHLCGEALRLGDERFLLRGGGFGDHLAELVL